MNRRFLIVLLSNYGSVISLGFFIPIFALFIVHLGGTAAEAGIATAIYYVLAGIFMLLFRLLINRSSNRPKYYIMGNALETLTALCFVFVTSVSQFYMVQIVHALATALRVPSQRALYAQFTEKGKEGHAWSIMEGGDFVIMGISAAAGGIIVTSLSFQTVFIIMAIVQGITTLYCLRLIKYRGWNALRKIKF